MEYVQELIANGIWGKLSGDAYIIAESKNQQIQLSYSAIAEDLGISVNTAKQYIRILSNEGLILFDSEAGTYKTTPVPAFPCLQRTRPRNPMKPPTFSNGHRSLCSPHGGLSLVEQ